MSSRSTPEDRFSSKYVIDPQTDCWVWIASVTNTGYGRFRYQGKMLLAHNFAYMVWGADEYDPDLQRDHLCKNTLCVNPDHLEQVTAAENMLRAYSVRTTCPQGHKHDKFNSAGHRICSQCVRDAAARYRAKKKAEVAA